MKAFEKRFPKPKQTKFYTPPLHIRLAREDQKDGWKAALEWALSHKEDMVNENNTWNKAIPAKLIEKELNGESGK
jgi:hypothetical protein